MSEVVDGRTDQLVEDTFAAMMEENPVDHEAVMDGIVTEGGEDAEKDAQPAAAADSDGVVHVGEASPREGTDTVLARLEESDPAAHEIVRGMQQNMTRMQNEWNDLRDSTLDTRQELLDRLEIMGSEDEGEPEPDPLETQGITEEHLNMFKTMAEHLDYVPRSELESRDVMASAEDYTNTMLTKGVEEFGEDFGTLNEDGTVSVKPEVQERLTSRLESLTDASKGITAYELFKLEFEPKPEPASEAAAVGEGGAVPDAPRTTPSPNANVLRRSTGSGQPVKIYDPSRGDTPEDVIERAFTLTRRELGV